MHLDKRFSVFCPKKLKEILGFSKSRRERPIKTMFEDPTVAPRAGAWIETSMAVMPILVKSRRSPCGSVD